MAPAYGSIPPKILKSLNGLELFQKIKSGELPAPPMAEVMNFHLEVVEKGRVVFCGTPGLRHYNSVGFIHGGYAATLLDTCMACAIHSSLEVGYACTTLELKVNLVRGLTDETGELSAEGLVIHKGRRSATAEGKLLDNKGRICAHGSTTCLIFEN
jgi:uncharacterized protein (TIGR00369 family)